MRMSTHLSVHLASTQWEKSRRCKSMDATIRPSCARMKSIISNHDLEERDGYISTSQDIRARPLSKEPRSQRKKAPHR